MTCKRSYSNGPAKTQLLARVREHPVRGGPIPRGRVADTRERVYLLTVEGFTQLQIAHAMGINRETVRLYLKAERNARARLASEESYWTEDAIAFYETVKRRSFEAHDRAQDLKEKLLAGELQGLSVRDNSLMTAIKAQERIDKIRGIDAPTKLEGSLKMLLESLEEDDDPDRPLGSSA